MKLSTFRAVRDGLWEKTDNKGKSEPVVGRLAVVTSVVRRERWKVLAQD